MHHAALVRAGDRVDHGPQEPQRVGLREPPARQAVEVGREGLAAEGSCTTKKQPVSASRPTSIASTTCGCSLPRLHPVDRLRLPHEAPQHVLLLAPGGGRASPRTRGPPSGCGPCRPRRSRRARRARGSSYLSSTTAPTRDRAWSSGSMSVTSGPLPGRSRGCRSRSHQRLSAESGTVCGRGRPPQALTRTEPAQPHRRLPRGSADTKNCTPYDPHDLPADRRRHGERFLRGPPRRGSPPAALALSALVTLPFVTPGAQVFLGCRGCHGRGRRPRVAHARRRRARRRARRHRRGPRVHLRRPPRRAPLGRRHALVGRRRATSSPSSATTDPPGRSRPRRRRRRGRPRPLCAAPTPAAPHRPPSAAASRRRLDGLVAPHRRPPPLADAVARVAGGGGRSPGSSASRSPPASPRGVPLARHRRRRRLSSSTSAAERFVPWAHVSDLDWDELGVRVTLIDGEEVASSRCSPPRWCDVGDASVERAICQRDALHERLRAGLEGWARRRAGGDAMESLLDRQGPHLDDWRAAVRRLADRIDGYRGVRLDPVLAARVLDDPSPHRPPRRRRLGPARPRRLLRPHPRPRRGRRRRLRARPRGPARAADDYLDEDTPSAPSSPGADARCARPRIPVTPAARCASSTATPPPDDALTRLERRGDDDLACVEPAVRARSSPTSPDAATTPSPSTPRASTAARPPASEYDRAACEAALACLDPPSPTCSASPPRVRAFHERQREGTALHRRRRRLARLARPPSPASASHAPGGKACYPSSVLMSAIPASVAGVGEVVLATLRPTDDLLAAVALGVSARSTSAALQAVAAFSPTAPRVPRVDKVVGPGNPTSPAPSASCSAASPSMASPGPRRSS